MKFTTSIFVAILASGSAFARDQISIVGSSTVYPFALTVAEQLNLSSEENPPVIESTGTGAGIKLFCQGVGVETPDITNASRAMSASEKEACSSNGVSFEEFVIGNDGITFANSLAGQKINLSVTHIAAALVKELEGQPNPLSTWADVDAYVASRLEKAEVMGLPNTPIAVMVPPATSGTRDSMESLLLKKGWKQLGFESEDYKVLREDSCVTEVDDDNTLVVEKLVADNNMFAIFGYSFFDQNRDKIQASSLDGIELNVNNIASYTYPGSRPLYLYLKTDHLNLVSGLKEYIAEFTSKKAISEDGYLFSAGLVSFITNSL